MPFPFRHTLDPREKDLMTRHIDLLFTTAPHPDGEFVESEDENGVSVSVGQWIGPSHDSFWRLRIPAPIDPAAVFEQAMVAADAKAQAYYLEAEDISTATIEEARNDFQREQAVLREMLGLSDG